MYATSWDIRESNSEGISLRILILGVASSQHEIAICFSCDVPSVNVRAGAGIVVLAVVNSAQVDEALFGPNGVVSGSFLLHLSSSA